MVIVYMIRNLSSPMFFVLLDNGVHGMSRDGLAKIPGFVSFSVLETVSVLPAVSPERTY